MGTNSKASHASYVVAPTAPADGAGPVPAEAVAPDLAAVLAGAIASPIPEPPADKPAKRIPEPAGSEQLADDADEPEEDQLGEQREEPAEPAVPDELLPVTRIPDTPEVGQAFGEPVLVGGADLHDSSATVVSYDSKQGPRTVLHTVVTEEAEAKLLDALNVTQDLVPAQVEETVNGRLPTDEQHDLSEALITAAKSVNHHINLGDIGHDQMPSSTDQKINAAKQALAAVEAELGSTPSSVDAAMLEHYQNHLAAIESAAAAGNKVSQVTPYLHEGKAIVTTYVPALPEHAAGDHVTALLRDATRIKPTLDSETGQASWNGTSRWKNVAGKEYAIDLGDGYSAVYRPYSLNNPSTTEYSMRGRLELVAPPGEGHGPDLVNRLGKLHLANRPMTRGEGEHSYLVANIDAQELRGNHDVTAALDTGAELEELVRQELFYERSHQAIGLDGTELASFAKEIQLEAATRALPTRVKVLRDAVAKATGHSDGETLAASAGYDPKPRLSRGWLSWNRFDVGNSVGKLQATLEGKALTHSTSESGLQHMLASGLLASTERRTMMGVKRGVGSSEDQDKFTGGASSVFTRLQTAKQSHGPKLVWDEPEKLLSRADCYGADGDTFGAVNPSKVNGYGAKSTRDPFAMAKFSASSNEIMFRDGIDLLGSEAPSRIICANSKQRDAIHAMLTAKGITHLAGKPLDEVLKH